MNCCEIDVHTHVEGCVCICVYRGILFGVKVAAIQDKTLLEYGDASLNQVVWRCRHLYWGWGTRLPCVFFDMREKEEKSRTNSLSWIPACALQCRAATDTDKTEKAGICLKKWLQTLLFMYVVNLGKELGLKGDGGEKQWIRPCVKNLVFLKEQFPIWIMLVQEALQFFCILSWEAAFTQLLSCCSFSF